VQYIVKAKYTVDGKEYTATLNSYDPAYKVGGDVAIKYDPNNPEKMTSGFGIGIAVMIIGAALLAVEARLGGAPRFTREGEQVRIKYPPEKPRYAIIIK